MEVMNTLTSSVYYYMRAVNPVKDEKISFYLIEDKDSP